MGGGAPHFSLSCRRRISVRWEDATRRARWSANVPAHRKAAGEQGGVWRGQTSRKGMEDSLRALKRLRTQL